MDKRREELLSLTTEVNPELADENGNIPDFINSAINKVNNNDEMVDEIIESDEKKEQKEQKKSSNKKLANFLRSLADMIE